MSIVLPVMVFASLWPLLYLFRRMDRVAKERNRVIRTISRLNMIDIGQRNFDQVAARWEILEAHTLGEMVFQVWKPVSSFYEGKI